MGVIAKERLTEEERELLLEVILEQRYASEVVSCELTDIETGVKNSEEERVRELNSLLLRLHKVGV